jgi:DNA-binding helix-hairpin-helix protein with protein kinase domain
MDNDEILNALIKGAIVRISDSGDARVEAMDDLSPAVRECFRASMTHDWEHQQQCPDCLEDEAENVLMHADSHREDGNVEDAQALELEAAVLRLRAEEFRHGK